MTIAIKTLAPAGPSIHEAFDVGVLGRFPGVDEIQLHAMIIGPPIERAPAQFRAVARREEGLPIGYGRARSP